MRRLSESSFFKNIVIMFSGSVSAQLILVLISPFLTRIYTPMELGQFTIFVTITSVLLPVLNGRYDMKIVSVEKKEEVNALVSLSIIISFIILVLTIFCILYLDFTNIKLFSIDTLYLYLLIPFIILGSINNILTSYINRLKKYKMMSTVLVLKSSIQSVLQIFLGVLSFSVFGLILSYIFSLFSGLLIQAKEMRKQYKFILNKKIFDVFLNYKDQLLYSTPSILANGLSHALIIFMIANLFTAHEVGMYSITSRVLGLPLTVIALSFSKVFYERAFSDYNQLGQFTDIYRKTSLLLLTISLPVFAAIAFISPKIFPIVFGAEWIDAGYYVLYLIPMYTIRLIVSSLSLAIIIINKQKVELFLQISFIISCLIVYSMTKSLGLNITEFLTLISVFFSVNYLVFYIYIYIKSKK